MTVLGVVVGLIGAVMAVTGAALVVVGPVVAVAVVAASLSLTIPRKSGGRNPAF